MEEKVVVLSTPLWARLEKPILDLPDVKKIKQVKTNGFFWCENDKTPEENVAYITKTVQSAPGAKNMVFKVYPIINGIIDMDKSDKTREQKKSSPLFQKAKKDITEEEMAAFAAHSVM
ncbi:MAG: hypothetical protein HUJ54_05155 [Erysipelotrichaceae bacterium]|nr:hypothetical protein [Erysipelotrichaceae bacterium]